MGSFALVSMPLDLSAHDAARTAREIVEEFPGTQHVVLDAAAGSVTFEIQFPGNLSALVARLKASEIPVGESAHVKLPVVSLAPKTLEDADYVRRTLEEGPEIWDVSFLRGRYVLDAHLDGDSVEASILPSSNSMHQLYDALLKLGIVADGHAEPARST